MAKYQVVQGPVKVSLPSRVYEFSTGSLFDAVPTDELKSLLKRGLIKEYIRQSSEIEQQKTTENKESPIKKSDKKKKEGWR